MILTVEEFKAIKELLNPHSITFNDAIKAEEKRDVIAEINKSLESEEYHRLVEDRSGYAGIDEMTGSNRFLRCDCRYNEIFIREVLLKLLKLVE